MRGKRPFANGAGLKAGRVERCKGPGLQTLCEPRDPGQSKVRTSLGFPATDHSKFPFSVSSWGWRDTVACLELSEWKHHVCNGALLSPRGWRQKLPFLSAKLLTTNVLRRTAAQLPSPYLSGNRGLSDRCWGLLIYLIRAGTRETKTVRFS